MARRINVVALTIVVIGLVVMFGGMFIPLQELDIASQYSQLLRCGNPLHSDVVDRGSEPDHDVADQATMNLEDPATNPPLIMKVSMLYGDPNPVYEKALQSHIHHGELYNYPVKVLRQKMLGRLWTKPAWLLSVVLQELEKPPEERIEWIFWFDADTFIANPNIPLEVFLPPEPDYDHIHFLCGNDHNGLNDGAFLLRVNDFALHMLSASLSVETYRPDVSLKYSEQSAIEHVITAGDVYKPWDGTRYIDGYAKIPQRWMNAYMGARDSNGKVNPKKRSYKNSIKEGDLLLHFSGSGETKRERMTDFMDAWEADQSKWTKPFNETGYAKEVANFWKGFAKIDEQREEERELLLNNRKEGSKDVASGT